MQLGPNVEVGGVYRDAAAARVNTSAAAGTWLPVLSVTGAGVLAFLLLRATTTLYVRVRRDGGAWYYLRANTATTDFFLQGPPDLAAVDEASAIIGATSLNGDANAPILNSVAVPTARALWEFDSSLDVELKTNGNSVTCVAGAWLL